MEKILEFSQNDLSIGLTTRTPKGGPEFELTQAFLEQFKETLSNKKKFYALFYEPLLPTGFPDIVVASYSPSAFYDWNEDRLGLTILDIKILHHLFYIKGGNFKSIKKQLSLEEDILAESIEKLLDAKLIKRQSRLWIPKSITKCYSINNLQAIEVKIRDVVGVIEQASNNRWFASESCILLPKINVNNRAIELTKKLGIGIWQLSNKRNLKIVQKPKKMPNPSSYASWMFNEWIGRKIFPLL